MKRTPAVFQVSIGPRRTGGGYRVHASFGSTSIETELQLSGQLALLAERMIAPRATVALGDPVSLGQALGRALFGPPLVRLLLESARATARERNRLQLRLQIGPPELAALPWEYVTLGAARPWSPGLRADYALVRASRGVPPASPVRVDGPLRVLAIAAPDEALQLEALAAELAEPIRAGTIELQVIEDATPATLERNLLRSPVHILHCAAQVGRTERGAPRLLLRRGMDQFDLIDLLANTRGLRLVTLTGPQGDASAVGTAIPTLAAALLSPDLPATIALGSALPARHAARFAAACYIALAAGEPVDLATVAGRRALAELDDGRGWGGPQLRLVPGGEHLFNVHRRGRKLTDWARVAATAIAALALIATLAFGARMSGARTVNTSSAAQSPAGTAALPTPLAPTLPAPTLTATPLEPTPTITLPTPTAAAASIPQPAVYVTYITAPEDTLDLIAERLGSDATAIAALNHLEPQTALRADRPLIIPVYHGDATGAGGLIIRRGNPAARKVALTFDIEIDDTSLYAFLDILRQRGLHGTFFVTGRWVQAYPNAARAIVQAGDEISNHSLTHPYFTRIGLDGAASELQQTEQIIYDTTGISARPYFRFPYGESTAETVALVAREGYIAYHWSADDNTVPAWLDWAGQHPSEANGGILLFHGRPGTVAALPSWLDQLAALGLTPTTLTDTLR